MQPWLMRFDQSGGSVVTESRSPRSLFWPNAVRVDPSILAESMRGP